MQPHIQSTDIRYPKSAKNAFLANWIKPNYSNPSPTLIWFHKSQQSSKGAHSVPAAITRSWPGSILVLPFLSPYPKEFPINLHIEKWCSLPNYFLSCVGGHSFPFSIHPSFHRPTRLLQSIRWYVVNTDNIFVLHIARGSTYTRLGASNGHR